MFHFLRYSVPAVIASVAVIAAGCVAYVMHGGFRYSVEFTGGTELRVRFDKPQDTAAITHAIKHDWNGTVYTVLGANELIVRVPKTPEEAPDLNTEIKATIDKASVDNPVTIQEKNSLSSGVGETLKWRSIQAIIIALLCMLAYIAFRFKFAFAVGAVVALFHDALIVLAFFLILNREISIDVIGAILAVLGYSMNDTIIIFTRIRDNLKKKKGMALADVVNGSLNETLRRTLLTSSATLLVVASQFIFGGETIRNLSLTLLIGIIYGTFSSIFIASPVMMLLHKEEK